MRASASSCIGSAARSVDLPETRIASCTKFASKNRSVRQRATPEVYTSVTSKRRPLMAMSVPEFTCTRSARTMSPGGRNLGEPFGGGFFQRRTCTKALLHRHIVRVNRLPQKRQQRDVAADAFEPQVYALVFQLETLEREAVRHRALRADELHLRAADLLRNVAHDELQPGLGVRRVVDEPPQAR